MAWLTGIGIATFLTLALAGLLEWGHRRGQEMTEKESRGISAVDGAVFALVGLLLAFSFAGAQGRLEARRTAIVQEANAISTAWMRLDLAHVNEQSPLRDTFRDYVRYRVSASSHLPDLDAAERDWERSHQVATNVWQKAISATEGDVWDRRLLLDALNSMFDMGTVREAAIRTHIPWMVMALLVTLTGLAAVLAGRALSGGEPQRFRWHQWILALVFSLVLSVLYDLEHPRMGLIRLDAVDKVMDSVVDQVGISNSPSTKP